MSGHITREAIDSFKGRDEKILSWVDCPTKLRFLSDIRGLFRLYYDDADGAGK